MLRNGWIYTRTNILISLFLGCKDVKKCKCNIELTTLGNSYDSDITNLVLGQDKSLNVKFKLANVGEEPAIGTNFTFAFPIDLELLDDEMFRCQKQFFDYDGSGGGEEVQVYI